MPGIQLCDKVTLEDIQATLLMRQQACGWKANMPASAGRKERKSVDSSSLCRGSALNVELPFTTVLVRWHN